MNKRQMGKRARRSQTRFARRWCPPPSSRWKQHSPSRYCKAPALASAGRTNSTLTMARSSRGGVCRRAPSKKHCGQPERHARLARPHACQETHEVICRPATASPTRHLDCSICRSFAVIGAVTRAFGDSRSTRTSIGCPIRRAARPRTPLHLPVRRVRSDNRDLSWFRLSGIYADESLTSIMSALTQDRAASSIEDIVTYAREVPPYHLGCCTPLDLV